MKLYVALLFGSQLLAQTYRVQTASGIVQMFSEAYVAGVVTGESSVFRSAEGRKAMAVAARTYAARMKGRHSKEGFDFCSTTHCQRFVSASAEAIKAARETVGQLLWINGKPALSVYSRSCGGKTEDVSAVWPDIVAPYLRSHSDPHCSGAWTWSGSPEQIRQALFRAGLPAPATLRGISIVRRTRSGRAQLLSLDGELVSASAFRFAMGRFIGWNTVRSDRYSIEDSGSRILFRGSGEGHGVGLCQTGADQMGLAGGSYLSILSFYYPGTSLETSARDFRWLQLSGEGVTLHTVLPDSDRTLIGIAEDIIRRWRGRLPWEIPPKIDLYVYPDLDSFRNATGEPGWIAARTGGNKIELQPTAMLLRHHVLRSSLEHELLHCFVERAARPGLPVWFREGLVEHLAAEPWHSRYKTSRDGSIRQRENRNEAENAYQAARMRVLALTGRYGETTVLSWVVRGIPAEAMNSAPNIPNVNNR